MKSILIYSPYWRNFGGGERYILHLASSLSRMPSTKVTLLSQFPDISKDRLEKVFDLDLSQLDYKTFNGGARSLRTIVDGADVFIPLSNFRYIKAAPKQYVQALQVPYSGINFLTISRRIMRGNLREGLKDILRLRLLSHARNSSTLTLTNSVFVHDCLLRGFNVESKVLYPPIRDFLVEGTPKRKVILSVGRIFRGLYNDKRYDVLTEAFRRVSGHLKGWEYHIVGSVSLDNTSQAYLEELKKVNKDFPVFFHVNASHELLGRLYNESSIYWHGAGYGVDEFREPERTEHFGMSVVEGLSAKCTPIVVNKGGLKEIVSSEENGFLWESIDELVERTMQVADLRTQQLLELQQNARKRFFDFSMRQFEKRVSEIFLPLIN